MQTVNKEYLHLKLPKCQINHGDFDSPNSLRHPVNILGLRYSDILKCMWL